MLTVHFNILSTSFGVAQKSYSDQQPLFRFLVSSLYTLPSRDHLYPRPVSCVFCSNNTVHLLNTRHTDTTSLASHTLYHWSGDHAYNELCLAPEIWRDQSP